MTQKKEKVLIFNWKDIKHRQSGGAEIVTHEIAKRLVINGCTTTILTAKFPGCKDIEIIDGIKIIRVGSGKFTHYGAARNYYLKRLKNKFDIIIEEVNTIPYFVGLYKGQEKLICFYHQLAGKVWFYEIFFPLSLVGFLLEPIYTFLQSKINSKTITVSNSTKKNLQKFGFKPKNIQIITEGLENKPLFSLEKSLPKEKNFTVLFHSSLRPMKRPLEVFKSFRIFQSTYPDSKLWVSGGGNQTKLINYATKYNFLSSVVFFGRTNDNQKFELMQKAHVLCSSSVKEGWGLIVSEANSMGTPAISYDVDGLRDSTNFGAGLVCKNNPKAMAKSLYDIYYLVKNNPYKYNKLRQKSLEASKKLNFDQTYQDFIKVIGLE